MFFFHWFQRKPSQAPTTEKLSGAQTAQPGRRPDAGLPTLNRSDTMASEDTTKLRRQARREQMYVAIREAMARAGVLSASYRFKVLSTDAGADNFLVMMDLQRAPGDIPPQLAAVELLILQNARQRFDITVSGVYWRVHEVAPSSETPVPAGSALIAPLVTRLDALPARPAARRFEPVQADEVLAFQQALRAASTRSLAADAEKSAKTRAWQRPRARPLDDFEDTEITEAETSPVLSTTQYGDLN